MEFQDVVRRRRMVRNYTTTPVDPAIVDRALRNATRAPSAGFSQGWGFLVLDTPADLRRYWTATADGVDDPDEWLRGMMRAPVLVVPCSSKAAYLGRYAEPDKGWSDEDEARWPVPFWHMDAAMASLLILQTVVDEGLGGCFFGIPPAKVAAVRSEFSIPDAFDPIGALTLGHPAARPGALGSPSRRPRKELDEVVHRGSWGAGGHAPG
jgi:nitroreductase